MHPKTGQKSSQNGTPACPPKMTPKMTPEWESRNFSEASLRGTEPLQVLFRISDSQNAPQNGPKKHPKWDPRIHPKMTPKLHTTSRMEPLSRSGSIASSDDDFTPTNRLYFQKIKTSRPRPRPFVGPFFRGKKQGYSCVLTNRGSPRHPPNPHGATRGNLGSSAGERRINRRGTARSTGGGRRDHHVGAGAIIT